MELEVENKMEVENKPQPMAGFAVGVLSPGKRTNQVRFIKFLFKSSYTREPIRFTFFNISWYWSLGVLSSASSYFHISYLSFSVRHHFCLTC